MDNNYAEQAVRPFTSGRKNFVLIESSNGAKVSAILYSLVETAKLNNLNIYAYLQTVLLYMPDYKNEPEGIEELMTNEELNDLAEYYDSVQDDEALENYDVYDMAELIYNEILFGDN